MRVPLFFAIVLMGAVCRACADDWPVARHDARNTSRSAEAIRPPLKLAWKVLAPRAGNGPVMLASGGVVCIGCTQDVSARSVYDTHLFNEQGKRIWELTDTIPLYLHQTILIVAHSQSGRSQVECYDWKTRARKWSCSLGGHVSDATANVLGDLIYLAVRLDFRTSFLTALRLSNGEQVGRFDENENGWWVGPPAVDDRFVYWGASHWLHLLDPRTLKPIRGHYDAGNAYPIPVENGLLVQGYGHWAGKYALAGSKDEWGIGAWRASAHCLAEARGKEIVVEAGTLPYALLGLDVRNGQHVWKHPVLVDSEQMAVTSGGWIYFGGLHGDRYKPSARDKSGLYCLDAGTGHLVWKYEQPSQSFFANLVAISNGSLYVLGGNHLYRFAPSPRLTSSRPHR